MTRIPFLISLAILGVVLYIAYLNPSTVNFNLTYTHSYQIPMIVVILFSLMIGALIMGIFDLVKGGEDLWLSWLKKRREKKQTGLVELIDEAEHCLRTLEKEKAKKIFNEVLKKEPSHIGALYKLGTIFYQEGKYKEAISHFLKARILAHRDQDKIDILYQLGAAYADNGNITEAIETFIELKEVDSNSCQPLLKLRSLYMETNNWEEAYTIQKELLYLTKKGKNQLDSRDLSSAIYYEMGNAFFKAQDYRKAIAKFKEAIKLDPNFLPAYMALGETYLRQDKTDEALRIWEKGYEVTGSALFLRRQEQFFYQAEMPGKIIERYRKAILDNPSRPELYFLLADAYLCLEMPDEALAEITKIVEQEYVEYPLYYLSLGKIYEKKKEINAALEAYKSAFELQRPLIKPYRCKNCTAVLEEWFGRCPSCKEWNTVDLSLFSTAHPSA